MEKLTVKEARRILDTDANQVSDEVLEQDIEAATLFRDLFFNKLTKSPKKASLMTQNVP